MARVVDIDLLGQQVIYQQAELNKKKIIQYDHLVIALGSVTQMPAIQGLREHGFTMKDLGDAITLRDRAIEMLGEFEFFFRQGTQFYRGIGSNDYKISVVELTDRILPALEAGLADYAQKKLESRNVEFFLQNRVSAVDLNRVFLENGQVLEARTLIWAAGIAPNPLLSCLDVPCDKRGYILCSPDLRVSGQENVWAIGDCAVNPGPDGQAYPATAQHAVRQGKWLAKNLIRVLGGRDTTPCEIVTRGSLAALGCRTGVAEIFGLRLSGFPAWFLWRAVYLFKMPTFSRKLRIALDWTVDLLFSRDFVELGLHRGRQSGEAK
jgi:NADH dehydrogenase